MQRLSLAHLPTPLVQPEALARELDVDLWIKRDDATGGPEAGNKIRKLEYLLADATERGCNTLLTCGGLQSNHARATAVLGAALGMRAHLFLRTQGDDDVVARSQMCAGNVLIDRMVGAELSFITPAEYRERDGLMAKAAQDHERAGRRPYVIPAGGSNGLGALGYVRAMAEVRRQLDVGLGGRAPFDVIVHACGSGGTTAGLALGAGKYEVADEVRAIAVCDDRLTFTRDIGRIMAEARGLDASLQRSARLEIEDRFKGPAYGVTTPEQRRAVVHAARRGGLLFDPTYTGKAWYGLTELAREGTLRGKRVLFVHTGGLPGLLAEGDALADELE